MSAETWPHESCLECRLRMPSDERAEAHYAMTGHLMGWPLDEDAMSWPLEAPLVSTREEAEALYDRAVEFIEDEGGGERFGFGVCATGRCDEPCGPNGGCMRGAGRRSRGR